MRVKFLLAILATLSLAACLDINGESQARYEQCKEFRQGVTLGQLRSAFGPEKLDSGNPDDWYVFDPPGNYQLIYSGPIIAKIDSSGDVISLSCAEADYAFGSP